MPRIALLALLVAATVLAGCAGQQTTGTPTSSTTTPTGGTSGTPPATPTSSTTLTEEQARDLFARAADNEPTVFGMHMTITRDGDELLVLDGGFDTARNVSKLTVRGDPAALEQDDPASAAFLEDGVSAYITAGGMVYVLNDTAIVLSPTNPAAGAFTPESTPFGQFMDRDALLEELDDSDVEVESVRAVTWKGKPAMELKLRERANGTQPAMNATVVLYTNPERIAHVEALAPSTSQGHEDPFAGGLMSLDFLYDAEVDVTIPASATRALGLAHENSDPYGTGGGGEGYTATWTFSGDEDIDLDDVDAQVKDAASADPTSFGSAETLWSMRLSEGTKTQDGVTLAFHDADGSGTVSPGDTLTIESADGSVPQVVLYDRVTGLMVVPGPGLALLALGLALVSVVLRRK